ncbi:hypothetical protein DFH29DRAFT_875512 [Suillus ampliporus]|nr:hypothetical protein DFH29DRAFT_875512 [Suillus ampliporus]
MNSSKGPPQQGSKSSSHSTMSPEVSSFQNDLYMGHTALCYKHIKSSPWNAFFWKKHQQVREENSQESSRKAVLQDLLHNYGDEYCELSQDEKDCLIQEYDENREHKTKGVRTPSKLKINDVTQTLKAIKNEGPLGVQEVQAQCLVVFAAEIAEKVLESDVVVEARSLHCTKSEQALPTPTGEQSELVLASTEKVVSIHAPESSNKHLESQS